jgi:hypothetical protein
MMNSCILGADTFCQYVVNEPVQIELSLGSLYKWFELIHFLFEISFARVVANKFDVLLTFLIWQL